GCSALRLRLNPPQSRPRWGSMRAGRRPRPHSDATKRGMGMTTKKYETVLIEKQDGITWLIMNRPDKRNAMSPQLHLEMDDALAELAVDPQTQVLVLTGAGEAFCAGQDIKLYFRANDDSPAERAKARHASNQWRWQRLSTFPQPTIAMVNGYCFGGGFTQVCACDLALAADEALFGLSEVNWGI